MNKIMYRFGKTNYDYELIMLPQAIAGWPDLVSLTSLLLIIMSILAWVGHHTGAS